MKSTALAVCIAASANITVANGVITNWTDNNDENIDTTPISDIV